MSEKTIVDEYELRLLKLKSYLDGRNNVYFSFCFETTTSLHEVRGKSLYYKDQKPNQFWILIISIEVDST